MIPKIETLREWASSNLSIQEEYEKWRDSEDNLEKAELDHCPECGVETEPSHHGPYCSNHGELLSPYKEKARVYIDDPSEAPEGVEIQTGPRGGLYYVTDSEADKPPEEVHVARDTLRDGILYMDADEIAEVLESVPEYFVPGLVDDVQEYLTRTRAAPHLSFAMEGESNPSVQEWTNEFAERYGEEQAAILEEVFTSWMDWHTNREARPLWAYAAIETNNYNHPLGPGGLKNASPEQREAFRNYREFTQEKLREAYGDTVPAFRVYGGETAEKLLEGKEKGERVSFVPRTLSSWSTRAIFPSQFSDVYQEGSTAVVRMEVPVEDIWATSLTNINMSPDANEVVAGLGDEVKLKPEQISSNPGSPKWMAEALVWQREVLDV